MNAPVQTRIDLPDDLPETPVPAAGLAVDLAADTPADVHTVGQSLAHLRAARGWTIADVSARLKFSERQIIALETECWGKLPEGLGLRGLVRNYARLLGADSEALLAALALQLGVTPAGPKVGASSSPLASERTAHLMSQEPERSFPGGLVVGVLTLAVLAATAAYALGWWPGDSAGPTPALPAAPVIPE